MMLDAAAPVRPVVTANGAEVGRMSAHRLAAGGVWRVEFDLRTGNAEAVDLRMFLEHRGGALSETWIYRWHADDL